MILKFDELIVASTVLKLRIRHCLQNLREIKYSQPLSTTIFRVFKKRKNNPVFSVGLKRRHIHCLQTRQNSSFRCAVFLNSVQCLQEA